MRLGTRPIGNEHWFSQLLDGGADYSQSRITLTKTTTRSIRQCGQRRIRVCRHMPTLAKVIEREAERAKAQPDLLPMFSAYRLNQGVSDTVESLLISADVWANVLRVMRR